MTDSEGPLLKEVIKSLISQIQLISKAGDLEQIFVSWLLSPSYGAEQGSENLTTIAAKAWGAQRTYREVAILGFASAMKDFSEKQALEEGLKWLIARPAFAPNSPPSFEVNGIALLGFALGITNMPDPLKQNSIKWMGEFLPQSSSKNLSSFNRALAAAAAHVIGKAALVPTEISAIPSYFFRALHEKGVYKKIEKTTSSTLTEIFSIDPGQDEPIEAALKLAALEYMLKGAASIDFKSIAIEDISVVLSKLDHALKRWTWEQIPRTGRRGAKAIKWEIENEYHLQNLLWIILSALFPNLDDEENLKSSGPTKPRADLCIRQLQLVIEAKFMRDGSQSEQTKLINELAADASLYCVPGSGYTKVIPVIWDNSRSNDHHSEMIQGIEAIPNIPRAFIVSRPGRMQGLQTSITKRQKKNAKKVIKRKKTTKKKQVTLKKRKT